MPGRAAGVTADGPSAFRQRRFPVMITNPVRTAIPRVAALALSVGIATPRITAHAQAPLDSTVVTGSISGVNGRVPVRADVELLPVRDAEQRVRVVADREGRFRVVIRAPGPYRLRAAGLGFIGTERALPTSAYTSIDLAITLAGFPDGLARGPLVGVTSEADAEKVRPDMPPAVLLTPGTDGRRSGVLRARRDTVAYRVIDMTARTYLAPAGAMAYRWASDGEYEGLLFGAKGGEVRLVYDSALVAKGGGASSLRVRGAHPLAATLAQLDSMVSIAPARRCLIAAQAPPIDPADAVLADTSLSSRLQLVRRLLRADVRCQVHPALGTTVLAQFTPGGPLWALDDVMQRRVILLAARHAAGEARFSTPAATEAVRARFDAAIAAAADTALRFDLYATAAATFMPADTVTAQSYTGRLVAESYDDARVTPLLRLTGYNRVLQPDRQVPPFRVASMDSAGAEVTDASLRGRVYLLDVWATWCPDCIVEFPAMRALQRRFGSRGLTILSVSVDEEQATAERFRRAREPMPWRHAWAGNDPEGPLAGFEVQWLPTTILVGRDGRIRALAPKLESPEFAALLEEALR